MEEFKVNGLYTFGVVGIREANDGRKYIYLSDGERETYRVEPFDFQTEWEKENVPSTLECVVTGINVMNGLPYLKQRRYNVLKECYRRFNEPYAFVVDSTEIDESSKATYYNLKDHSGLYHRYYPAINAPKRDDFEVFSLIVTGIKENDKYISYLTFEEMPQSQTAVEETVVESVAVADVPCDLMSESRFGVENSVTEFKSSIVYPAGTVEPDIDSQMKIILQTIAGFQNAQGGTLYIGVNDRGQVCGINNDFGYLNSSESDYFNYKNTTDGYELKIRNSIKKYLGNLSNANVDISFYQEDGLIYCVVNIAAMNQPVFMDGYKLFQRAGNMTQWLKYDQITWFIHNRLNATFGQLSTPQVSLPGVELEAPQDVIPTEIKLLPVDEPAIAEVNDDVWVYITFYDDGCWSYQDDEVKSDDVVWQVPIFKKLKKEVLLMCYDNGCVNPVNPYRIIKPAGQAKAKTKGKRYQNGWNTDAKITAMMNVHKYDLVTFYSKDVNGVEWVKIHRAVDIKENTTLHTPGKILVNPRFNAKPTAYKHLTQDKFSFVSSLILNKNQTSTHLGVRKDEPTFAKTMKLVDELCGMK